VFGQWGVTDFVLLSRATSISIQVTVIRFDTFVTFFGKAVKGLPEPVETLLHLEKAKNAD
jgi:hypothetical protein